MIEHIYLSSIELTSSQWFCNDLSVMPSISHQVIKRGNYPGATVYPGKFGSIKISGEWIIVGTTFSDLAAQVELFRKTILTALKSNGATLEIDKSNGIGLVTTVLTAKVSTNAKAEDKTGRSVLVEFDTAYPYLKGSSDKNVSLHIVNGGGMAIPMSIPMNMSAGASSDTTATNSGEYEAYPVITITGPIVNPVITNLTNGKQMSLTYTLASSSDSIIIDCYNRTAVITTTGNNARPYLSGDFITLDTGVNMLRLGAGSYNANGMASLTYRDTYLGI